MSKREAYWVHDDKGGYWQIPVEGEAYNFRTPPGFVMHPKGEAVTDAEILWDMRHIDDHLKYSEDAASMLIQGVRKVLRRVVRPAEAQGGGDMTECGHSKYDPCHNCELLDAPPSAPVGEAVAWEKGYKQGILDERISEANIGIAGYGAKVEPARNNPYLAQQPSAAPALPLPGDRGSVQPLFNPQPPAEAQDIGPEWKPCRKRPVVVHVREQRPDEQHISTREGITPVMRDDLIIRGVEGEEYPIGRELFTKTYDMVPDAHPAEAHCTTCSCVPGMTPAVRFDTTPAEKEGAVRDHLIRMGWTPPAEAPVGVEGLLADLETIWHSIGDDKETNAAYQRLKSALAQQPAAVNEAMAERIAALLHEEATDEPWSVAGVEHDGPDRDYYRTLARKVIALAAQQPAAAGELAELVGLLDEVRSHFTRDDDLPDDLLPRIDAALAQQQGGEP